ncbi:DUF4389 domain-containing protein [Nocardioides guangzhouensis]|uniref:DUF4389 domain-containing protein n=1 Tax=Nocardioides guangzhouensis TaxID=2497878 RepID=A0A4Q4ZH68_9ACTN|nr:DUF4389 domain-containing protein [Nocardioides guangzhouensis]RYP86831.1 DUF4389 domain-containing protein [Nocardioides guangzhouensis]
MSAHPVGTAPVPAYPVRVDARLDDHLSRWLWLVKWLLAIPHFLVLALLWIAFVVLSAIALVAILFTGRYPRGIFDFNVGVLRWTWRVSYYTYGGLGTDQYPPFTLEERPDYPAHLEIAYPDHLSRGLVLVKWWLLAIPHYLVLGLVLGGGVYAASHDERSGGTGLLGLLVLVAAVVLLFTGRYPGGIFDFVLGLNRWWLRVAAYAGLMTDAYPPFRIDLGGTDPGTAVLAAPPAPAPPGPTMPAAGPPAGGAPPVTAPSGPPLAPPPGQPPTAPYAGPPVAPRTPSRWNAGRIIAVIIGSLLAMTSVGLLLGGLGLRVTDSVLRDEHGYLMSSTESYGSPGHAVVSDRIELGNGFVATDLPRRWLGTVTVVARSQTPAEVFVGIAHTDDVEAYLSGVERTLVTDPSGDNGDPETAYVPGGPPPAAPGQLPIWVASAQGSGQQTLTWEPQQGDWTVVVMNADGSTPVQARVAVGAELPVLGDIALWLLGAGFVVGLLAVVVIVLAVPRTPRTATPQDVGTYEGPR